MKILNITVNGIKHQVLADENASLANVLRDKLNLTGTKIGCSQGSCGACTVIVDGNATLSCITPAMRCENASVTTIESVSTNGTLHDLQEKFVSKGAIQCGFCTPGMVMTALDFCNKNHSPSLTDIQEALSGNVCRCTGYKKIIEAVSEYAADVKLEPASTSPFKSVGVRRPYIEASKKVQGAAEYADDIRVKNAIYCKLLRSTHAHAKIISIDTSFAESLPGVHAVMTGQELLEKFGVLPISQDETAMAIEKTRYIGEVVAAVAAESEDIAKEALGLIKVKYARLKSFFEIDESITDIREAEKIHAHCKFNNNIHKKAELRFGNQKKGLEEADITASMEFEFSGINHAFTEPHAATAWWDENGLTIITATQVPHYLHRSIAKVMQVPLSRVRVIKPYVGGGFGGKSDPFSHEMIISHLARKSGRPVRICLTREEVFITHHGRHPSRMKVEMGISKEGLLQVLDADIAIDGGAYGSFGVVTSYYNGVLLQAPYNINNFGFKTFRVYTNKPQCGAMRGHGAVNSRFAVESILDHLANELKMDPCKLRLKNFLPPDTLTVGEYRITSNGSKECLDTVRQQSGWNERFGNLNKGHGLGVACGFFISGSALPIIRNELPQSVVHLKLDFDGRVVIYSGASDIGQGSDTMLAVIVSEVLTINLDHIFVMAADTLHTPVDFGSYSSRVTFMAGNAAKQAAENLRTEILEAIAAKTKIPLNELQLAEGRVFTTDKTVDFDWLSAVEIVTAGRGAFTTHGKYISPKLGGDFKGAGAGLSPSYSFGACIAEVDVDVETGYVKVLNIWGAHDCGKALNPLAVEGQLEGSWHMGMGQAMSEEVRYHEGLLVNNSFLDYKIPTSLDTPPIHTNIVETIDPEGPFGAKECGEGAIHPVLPAIANAIFNAVGVRITRLPIRPEDILNELNKRKKQNSNADAL